VLEGQFEGMPAREPKPAEPLVVFAGRQIPEKSPVALVSTVATARETIPELRGVIHGDGRSARRCWPRSSGSGSATSSRRAATAQCVDDALGHANSRDSWAKLTLVLG
jgi:hypothetical protein